MNPGTSHAPRAGMRALTVLALVIGAIAAGATLGARPADAAVIDTVTFDYTGGGDYTRIFFDRQFTANLPDWLPDRADGRLKGRIVFESTTAATIHAPSTLTVDRSAAPRQGESITVATSQRPLDQAVDELRITTRPAVHILWDYQPDDTKPLGCAPFDTPPSQFNRADNGINPFVVPVKLTSPDQNERCGSISITANMLLGLELPEVFELIKADFVPLMAGQKHFQRNEPLFDIRVCKMLSHYFPAVAFLGDSCSVKIVGIVEVDLLLTNTATDGFRATADFMAEVTLPMGGATIPVPVQGSERELHWSSTTPVAHTLAVPCSQQAGKALSYRLRNNRYQARVKNVELGIAAEFWVDPPAVSEKYLFTIFTLDGLPDLLEGREIAVTAPGPNRTVQLGDVLPEQEESTVSPGGPYAGVEGASITFTARGTGTRGSFDNCDADGDTLTYEWAFVDGTRLTGKTATRTFPDSRTYGATLTVRDPAGNVTGVPFFVTVNNAAPTATFNAPETVNEGGAIALSLTGVADPSPADTAAGFQYAFDCGDGAGYSPFGATPSRECGTVRDNGTRTVKGKVRDRDLDEREYTKTVTIANVAPTVQLSPTVRQIVPVGTTVTFNATATDPGADDTLTYAWDFGDGATASAGPTTMRTNGQSHRFARPCICTVTLNVKDKDGTAAQPRTVQVVVYDPASKVTGDGRFVSDAATSLGVPAGTSYTVQLSAQYDRGATAPKGSLDAQAPDAKLAIRMTAFEFLVVTEREAILEGLATVNGQSGWKFRVTTPLDGGNITLVGWRPGQSTLEQPEYRIGGPRKEGTITVHDKDR